MSPNSINPIQFNQQFRTQIPFSIPPPGGISYMLQPFSDPYGINPYNNPMLGNKFGPSLVPSTGTNFPQPNTKSLPTNKVTEKQLD